MKSHILDFKDITDSREIFEAKTPPFMSIFIYGILIMMTLALTWMWFGDIDDVVRADGIVKTKAPVSIVTNIVEGEVKEVFFREDHYVNRGDILYTLETTLLTIERESVLEQIKRLKEKSENLALLEKSINENKNLFNEINIEYYNRFHSYSYELELLNLEILRARTAYERQQSMEFMVSEAKMEELRSELRVAELNLQKYKSEHKVRIKEERGRIESEIILLTEKLKNLTEKIDLCSIRAPISGKIQVIKQFNPGDYLHAGTEVVRVIPEAVEAGSILKIELIISNKDIAKIEKGKKIRYSFISLPQSKYGFAGGEIVSVGGDISTHSISKDPVFNVEGSLDTYELMGTDRTPVRIKVGMICDARIIIRKRKIIDYVLESLNFLP